MLEDDVEERGVGVDHVVIVVEVGCALFSDFFAACLISSTSCVKSSEV